MDTHICNDICTAKIDTKIDLLYSAWTALVVLAAERDRQALKCCCIAQIKRSQQKGENCNYLVKQREIILKYLVLGVIQSSDCFPNELFLLSPYSCRVVVCLTLKHTNAGLGTASINMAIDRVCPGLYVPHVVQHPETKRIK